MFFLFTGQLSGQLGEQLRHRSLQSSILHALLLLLVLLVLHLLLLRQQSTVAAAEEGLHTEDCTLNKVETVYSGR